MEEGTFVSADRESQAIMMSVAGFAEQYDVL